ncbi:PCDBF protein, partial [Pomatorhinus ruficollis]|nr:PCDBF protein [Pomatorhinus ruficollis]
IAERSDPGSRFPLEVARDLDIGSNSIQAYSISPENEYFSVSYGSRSNGDKYVELVLEKTLDREEQAEMSFSVIAEDGGTPPRSGTVKISIIILDINDNAPIFMQERYIGKVLENMPEGSVVLSVLATDKDVGVNGDVSYQLNQAAEQKDSTFVIDPRTGEIKLTKPLDFEAAQTHELSVRATDGGGLSAICKVLVEVVIDVNNYVPEIVIMSVFSPVPEDTPLGTVIAIFSVQDRDSGANGEVQCSISDSHPFRLEKTFDNYYRVVTAELLDRERVSEYNVTVRAADGGSPALQSSAVLALRVLDVNDNAPVFAEERYSARLAENNAAGALVLTVRATDADWGQNARVRY